MLNGESEFSTKLSEQIPPASADRPPLRTNVYDTAWMANTSLATMFPYVHRGSIVPGATLFMGGEGAEFGHFFHENTEEEIALVMGGRGTMKPTGTVMIAPLLHGVQAFLKDQNDPNNYLLIVITQRQPDDGEQRERVFWRCGCNEVLFEHAYEATPSDTYDPHSSEMLLTTRYSSEAAELFNADVANRTCKRCGKIADPFPIKAWGWTQNTRSHDAAAEARAALLERAKLMA
jgi:hypothetical protein